MMDFIFSFYKHKANKLPDIIRNESFRCLSLIRNSSSSEFKQGFDDCFLHAEFLFVMLALVMQKVSNE